MANDLNKQVMMGRLVRDPDVKMTNGGMTIANITIANNRSVKDGDGYKDETGFFNWVAFGKTAENIAKFFKKGERILLAGRARFQSWENAEGKKMSKVEFEVGEFYFVEKRDSSAGGSNAPENVGTFGGGDDVEHQVAAPFFLRPQVDQHLPMVSHPLRDRGLPSLFRQLGQRGAVVCEVLLDLRGGPGRHGRYARHTARELVVPTRESPHDLRQHRPPLGCDGMSGIEILDRRYVHEFHRQPEPGDGVASVRQS